MTAPEPEFGELEPSWSSGMSAKGEWGGVALKGTWAHGAHRQHSYPERDNKHTVDGIYR